MSSAARVFSRRTQDAGLSLKVWMLEHDASLKQLASALACSVSSISSWRSGRHAPNRAQAVKLEQLTAGAVTAGSWDA